MTTNVQSPKKTVEFHPVNVTVLVQFSHPHGFVWKWLVPRKTQWFCWSLSLRKMAMSLGVWTPFSDIPTNRRNLIQGVRCQSAADPYENPRRFWWGVPLKKKKKMWIRRNGSPSLLLKSPNCGSFCLLQACWTNVKPKFLLGFPHLSGRSKPSVSPDPMLLTQPASMRSRPDVGRRWGRPNDSYHLFNDWQFAKWKITIFNGKIHYL